MSVTPWVLGNRAAAGTVLDEMIRDVALKSAAAHDQITVRGRRNGKNGDSNKLAETDRPAHGWFRFVLSYPPHLVRHYLEEFGLKPGSRVLDPFCGTGTTIVECRKNGIGSIGIEANRMAFFASQVKVDWSPDLFCLPLCTNPGPIVNRN
jgi:hypothetical protein